MRDTVFLQSRLRNDAPFLPPRGWPLPYEDDIWQQYQQWGLTTTPMLRPGRANCATHFGEFVRRNTKRFIWDSALYLYIKGCRLRVRTVWFVLKARYGGVVNCEPYIPRSREEPLHYQTWKGAVTAAWWRDRGTRPYYIDLPTGTYRWHYRWSGPAEISHTGPVRFIIPSGEVDFEEVRELLRWGEVTPFSPEVRRTFTPEEEMIFRLRFG